MTQVIEERVSALIDNALDAEDRAETLDAISRDPVLRDLWDRYHLVGEALRGEPISLEVNRVADRVRERLAQEATLLTLPVAPVRPRWSRPLGGLALAASVALVAILAGRAWYQEQTGPGTPMLAGEAPSPRLYGEAAAAAPYWSLKRPEVESKLNRLLVNHQEYAISPGMTRMAPYATFVSHDVQR